MTMRTVLVMATGAMLLAGCLKPAEIEADHAWVRLPAVAGRPAAGYVTLTGGETPARIVNVSADRAIRTEMHESMGGASGAMATMRPLAAVDLPAHGQVAFAPGGKHLMLFGVSPALKPGETTLLTFTFADGSHLQRKAWIVGAGDAAPE
jgi:copper(I)-binding protein